MRCGCENGYACTIISVCAVESMVYDAVEELETALSESMKLERKLNGGIAKLQSRIEELEAQIELCGMPAVESADHIVDLRSRIEAVRKLKLYAPTNDGYGGWKMVYADGNESQTFVDADELREALGGRDEQS